MLILMPLPMGVRIEIPKEKEHGGEGNMTGKTNDLT